MSELKRTPLRDFHAARGARLVDFAGWEMPVQYRSILEEHKAVRRAAGLFDVSHMGEVEVKGPGAGAFLNQLVTNDVSKLFPGRVLYTPMCRPDGGVVDDLLVYMKAENDYFLVINAGNIAKDLEWMRARQAEWNATGSLGALEGEKSSFAASGSVVSAGSGGADVHLTDPGSSLPRAASAEQGRDLPRGAAGKVDLVDRSDDYALLAVQGPNAVGLVQGLTGAKLGLLKYYHFLEGTVAGVHCLISRTGYTGEDGVELYHAAGDSVALTQALMQTGGIELAGLGARDSLRLEAGFPLYGHELSDKISPIAAGLGWTVKLDKGDFVGREALAAEKAAGPRRKVIFFRTGDRRIARAGTPVLSGGTPVGEVLSGTLSPILNEAIGSALVDAAASAAPLEVDIRGARLPLRVVKPPFVELKKAT